MNGWFWFKVTAVMGLAIAAGLLKRHQLDEEKRKREETRQEEQED